jgi:hypothetical protein
MFNPVKPSFKPSNNEIRRETWFHAVKQCSTGFFIVSGEENLYQALLA